MNEGRWGRAVIFALILLLGLPLTVSAQSTAALGKEVSDVESLTGRTLQMPLQARAPKPANHVERRLVDGELHFRLRDYERASLFLTDVVENYPNHPIHPDALYLLAESLYRSQEYGSARRRFRQLVDQSGQTGYGQYLDRALGRLLNIALKTRDFEDIDTYFQRLSRMPGTALNGAAAYYRGKYLYLKAQPEEDKAASEKASEAASANFNRVAAVQVAPSFTYDKAGMEQATASFEAVPEGSPYAARARYFAGVIAALKAEYPRAIQLFSRAAAAASSRRDRTHRQVKDLSNLALGRLYYETGQVDRAIKAYQSIPRSSR